MVLCLKLSHFNEVLAYDTVAERMLNAKGLKYKEHPLTVELYNPFPKPDMDPDRTVVVDGLTREVDTDTLWDLYENNDMSGGGTVEDVDLKLGLEMAYITFDRSEGTK